MWRLYLDLDFPLELGSEENNEKNVNARYASNATTELAKDGTITARQSKSEDVKMVLSRESVVSVRNPQSVGK